MCTLVKKVEESGERKKFFEKSRLIFLKEKRIRRKREDYGEMIEKRKENQR